jgi:hypothetical protein
VNRARAALGDAATVFRAGQAQRITQHPQERGVGIDIDFVRLSVDRETGHHAAPRSARGT